MILSGLLLLIAAVFAGCGGKASQTNQPATPETNPNVEAKSFTLAELAQFNGKNGNPAYVAVDGVVYDVTDSSLWPEGKHTPCNLDAIAGKDLSDVIKQAPARMRDDLKRFPVVGQLAP